MRKIEIELADEYSIYIKEGLLSDTLLVDFCRSLANTVVIIADDKVASLYGENLLELCKQQNVETYLLKFTGGEEFKTRETKAELEDQMLKLHCGRDTCVVALGGGITTDMAGFVAATYYRSIPVVYLPTSLLAMVDAAIGGKTGVNTPLGKNLIGVFCQPKAVFMDPLLLKTLPKEEFNNGLVEMIKHAIIDDPKYFSFMKDNEKELNGLDDKILEKAITASCVIKKSIIEQDEKDYGLRQILNFGHTIGHALEQASDFQVSHGRAVAIGMIAEAYISKKLEFLPQEAFDEIATILEQYGIPLTLGISCTKQDIKRALLLDKKAVDHQVRFVLLDDIGQIHHTGTGYTMTVADEVIDEALDYLFERYGY